MVQGVKHIILVLSGKGGVGKSTVSVQLSLGLKEKGFKVGLLDIDLCGPSIPYLLDLEGSPVHKCPDGWVPVYTDKDQSLAVMSIGFLLANKTDSVVWRGPKKNSMIKQFVNDVYWQELDYLIIDTPPGTSDEHITIVECLKDSCDGAVLVTTPQAVSLEDVHKEITFCKKTGVNILGLIENMSGFVCPNCSECTNIFSSKGGKSLAEHTGIPFLGTIPIDPNIARQNKKSILTVHPNSKIGEAYDHIIKTLTCEKMEE
ncbi:cytosolic Fe-S cluster assembly factor NUBP2 homolog [Cimex lectularius]|uniref:Cytosolic Fe-S cluster assembly factor NUBP2 homolog n=1 Tax=Cimex lectularius TaxID=79782 RepID=A0A8I6THQ0_CIMLE|nr:cytosolic Fe-S cluster assembly factor NUBP2 homolog [Cimex lectularius]